MPHLLLGPLLRYVSDTEATVWVETDAPCTVAVELDDTRHEARTISVAGHHVGLVICEGLRHGRTFPYTTHLDGEHVWPLADDPYPPCVVRTHAKTDDPDDPPGGSLGRGGGQLQVAFGSCRVSVPHEEPYTLDKDENPDGREVDALLALTERMRTEAPEQWPDLMLFLGDQVYADEVSPKTEELIERRRPPGEGPPREEVADFEEYMSLYRESWSDPSLRWLMSTVATAMIFDDHDVHDDWNTSDAWRREIRAKPWWEERIVGGFMSYWLCQHLGNLSPAGLRAEKLFCALTEDDTDADERLAAFARQADEETASARWSFRRDLGRTRLLVLDSRAGRVLTPGARQMLSDGEFAWIRENLRGEYDHLLIGTSIPFLLAHGLHHGEAFSEALCDGVWGRPAAWLAEKVRQGLDLEHWPAFQASFSEMTRLIEEVTRGDYGPPPATITFLSGDVHHAYLAEARLASGPVDTRILQAVCSPVRNPLSAKEERLQKLGFTRSLAALNHRLARWAGVEDPRLRWAFAQAPTFDNQIAQFSVDGRTARLQIEKTLPEDRHAPKLRESLDLSIAPQASPIRR